jgi:integrative and conjugative element protein (TIGR02256 family)
MIGRCVDYANEHHPFETGGTFMGYWSDSNTAVITASIGVGPDAVRERHNFEPDQVWQEREIAVHYEATGRRETYIGDWHSHPNARNGRLSRTDRRILRRIIATPSARVTTPIMAIFHGKPDQWRLTIWRGELLNRALLWPKLFVKPARIERY